MANPWCIVMCVQIYRRALDTTHMPDTAVPMDALRAEVASVVEYEVSCVCDCVPKASRASPRRG